MPAVAGCRRCGAPLDKAARFCGSCGASIGLATVSLVEVEGVEDSLGWEVSSTAGPADRVPSWWPIRRIVALAAVVAAAVVGVVAATGGDGDAEPVAETPTSTTDVPVSSTTQPGSSVSDGTPVSAEVLRLVDGTGAALPAPVLGEPTGLSLVGYNNGEIALVDLDTGAVNLRSDRVHIGDDDVDVLLLAAVDDRLLLHVAGNSAPRTVSIGPAGAVELAIEDGGLVDGLFAVPGRPAVWQVPTPIGMESTSRAQLISLDTGDVEATIDIPPGVFLVGATGRGIIVTGVGGVYEIPVGGLARRLSAGWAFLPPFSRSVASPSGPLLIETCDDTLSCETNLLDAATGLARSTALAAHGFSSWGAIRVARRASRSRVGLRLRGLVAHRRGGRTRSRAVHERVRW